MVEVDRTWFAILATLCCVPSVVAWSRLRLREFRDTYGKPRRAPGHFVETCLDGLMMGLGTGLSITAAVVIAEILLFLALA